MLEYWLSFNIILGTLPLPFIYFYCLHKQQYEWINTLGIMEFLD